MSRIQSSSQPPWPHHLLQGVFSGSPGTHLSNPGLAWPRGRQGRLSEVWLGAKQALLALHSSAALQPQKVLSASIYFSVSPHQNYPGYLKHFRNRKITSFATRVVVPPSRSPQAEGRRVLTSSLPWLPDTAGRTHVITSPQPPTNPIFRQQK